jgi:hypothetical protein
MQTTTVLGYKCIGISAADTDDRSFSCPIKTCTNFLQCYIFVEVDPVPDVGICIRQKKAWIRLRNTGTGDISFLYQDGLCALPMSCHNPVAC